MFLLFLCACGNVPEDSARADWLRILQHKKQASAPTAGLVQRQIYADSLMSFVDTHPDHSPAREAYHRLQISFGDELSSLGHYREASLFYRAVLRVEPKNVSARAGLRRSMERMAVNREKLHQLTRGMSKHQVEEILGKPLQSWRERRESRGVPIESWYYPTSTGSVAGVYFQRDRLLAAEENSQSRLNPMNWQ